MRSAVFLPDLIPSPNGLSKADIKSRFGAKGLDVALLAPDPFSDHIKREIAKWIREGK